MKVAASMAIACGFFLAGQAGAFAQAPEDTGAGFPPTVTRGQGTEHLRTPMGTSIQVGGGVANFFSEPTRDATNVGGFWQARAVIGTRSFGALELGYIGTAQDIRAAGLDPDAALVSHGFEGSIRLQFPWVVNMVLMEPFVTGGIGWSRYGLVMEDTNTSVVDDADHVFTVPLGAGFAVGYRGFIADARFTYRQTYDDDSLLPVNTESGSADLQNWNVGVMLGYEF